MIALTMVVKDCADTLRQGLSCIAPYVDQIIIVLGGPSTDDTEKVAREFTEEVYPVPDSVLDERGCLKDFSAARNYALTFVKEPYWMWIDGDDVTVTGCDTLASLLEWMKDGDLSCCWLPYVYQHDKHGNATQVQMRERIMCTADGWYWVNRVHETCACDKPGVSLFNGEKYMSVVHALTTEDGTEKTRRNKALLEKARDEEPYNMRHVLALAHAEYALEDHPSALTLYENYYYKPESRLEQWWAACQATRVCLTTGQYEMAKSWGLAALQADSRYKDPYCLLAQACWWGEEDADATLAWASSSVSKEEAPLAACRFPREYTMNLWDAVHRAYATKGDYARALEIVKKAQDLEPTVHWEKYHRIYAEAVRAESSVAAALTLADHLTRRGDTLRARWLLESNLPVNIRETKPIKDARALLQENTRHAYDLEVYGKFYGDGTPGWHDNVATVLDPYRWEWIFEHIKRAGVKTVLDVGCGRGAPALEMARRCGVKVVGIDLHARNVKQANKDAKEAGLDCDFRVADLETFSREHRPGVNGAEPFDLVVLAEIIEHLPPHLVGHYLLRADQLGNRVIMTTPYPLSGDWPGIGEAGGAVPHARAPREHLLEFTQKDLEEMVFQEGRRPVELYSITQGWDEADGVQQRCWMAEYDHEPTNDLPVVFMVGASPEEWTPRSIDAEGLGGSETAVARMAEEFCRRGHRVVVYSMTEGVHNGVVYRHFSKFDPRQESWLLVLTRQPGALQLELGAQNVWLWCHDIHYGPQPHLGNAARTLVLSEWHKQDWESRYPDAPEPTITSNGLIPITRPLESPKPHSFIYASSPDRGLDVLLEWWPHILKMWKDAELHVYYGFNYINALAERLPHLMPFKLKINALAQQEGVFWHGRVGQAELHDAFAQTQFWLYPSITPSGDDWYETYCITALEAQAHGCIPVTRPVGALPERMAYPKKCLVDSTDFKEFLAALKMWDKMPEVEKFRQGMADYAREYTWEKVCDQWLEMVKVPVPA